MATPTFSCSIYPTEWTPNQPNYFLGISGLITTGFSFSASGTVMDSSLNPVNLGTFNLATTTGFTYIGCPGISFSKCTFPIVISGTVICSTTFNSVTSSQHSLGSKSNSSTPVAYQVSLFCNDAGSDDDWNDLVLNFQLFDSSAD